jgi:hypothetical protein
MNAPVWHIHAHMHLCTCICTPAHHGDSNNAWSQGFWHWAKDKISASVKTCGTRAGGVVQEVECLTCKWEAMGLSPVLQSKRTPKTSGTNAVLLHWSLPLHCVRPQHGDSSLYSWTQKGGFFLQSSSATPGVHGSWTRSPLSACFPSAWDISMLKIGALQIFVGEMKATGYLLS